MKHLPSIVVTAGDPCGIGSEVLLKALTRLPVTIRNRLLIIGDQAVFQQTARQLRLQLPDWQQIRIDENLSLLPRGMRFLDLGHTASFRPGRSTRAAGAASLNYLKAALTLWHGGQLGALVTAPVTKWAIERSESGFTGHTEYFSRRLRVPHVVMMFVSDRMRVVLLTRHVPLAQVSRLVTSRVLRRTLQMTDAALRRSFHVRRPTLAVCGLNPHAGEEGLLGAEEGRIARPVMRALRRQGIRCEGPFAADGLFASQGTGPRAYDAIVCWYHDQGLIPFKMVSRDHGCQLTVGLPFIRTSPDHGSALDIAGTGRANPGSMRYAIELAARLC